MWKWNFRSCGFIERKCDITSVNKLTFKKWNEREDGISKLFHLLEKNLVVSEKLHSLVKVLWEYNIFQANANFLGRTKAFKYTFLFHFIFFSIWFFFANKQLPTWSTPYQLHSNALATDHNTGDFFHGHHLHFLEKM